MPVDPLSRYRHETPHQAPDTHGVEHASLPARWTAPAAERVVFHQVAANDSFETLAARFFGSSAQWWRIADANPLVFPLALEPGTVIAVPTSATSPVRTRNW